MSILCRRSCESCSYAVEVWLVTRCPSDNWKPIHSACLCQKATQLWYTAAWFKVYVRKVSHQLKEYFEKYWFPCYLKWSNVGRAQHFSRGNTTTNIVESNWTQVNATIGANTGIDKCVSALIQHQVKLLWMQSVLSKEYASSRIMTRLPSFLHSVAPALSTYAWEKVEYE